MHADDNTLALLSFPNPCQILSGTWKMKQTTLGHGSNKMKLLQTRTNSMHFLLKKYQTNT